MNRRITTWVVGLGCGSLLLLILVIASVFTWLVPRSFGSATEWEEISSVNVQAPGLERTQAAVPTLTLPPEIETADAPPAPEGGFSSEILIALYEEFNPGVVNITMFMQQQGQLTSGSGSGFIIDDSGHIVTNNHVVALANRVSVFYFDGAEAEAEVVGTDPDSDLAVIRVERLPDNARVLLIGDSDAVQVGEIVVAIGNPFGLGSSLTAGVISAIGRTIPAGARPFAIPQAIQTDAAVNPGNSGGPLLNLRGEVIGVNAQIATTTGHSAGVGFAIPSNVVRRVVPVLIETGTFQWPWLGIEGGSVDLLVQGANNLAIQSGAYIHSVVPGSPADRAGLQGSTGSTQMRGYEIPSGGDIVTAVDGNPVMNFSDLLLEISLRDVRDTITLTILRDGTEREVAAMLVSRPE
jgi:2-alkenal reductase